MSTEGRAGREVRIGDAEREAAVTALGEHFAAGRLTKDEYDERAGVAFAARTSSQLAPLFADLPGPHHGSPVAGSGAARGRRSGAGLPYPAERVGGRTAGERSAGSRGFRLPLLPVLLVLIGIAVLAHAPWLVFVGLGLWWCTRAGRACGGYRSGRDRAAGGSWA